MSAPTNVATIERFYSAFAQRDTTAMAACYRDDAIFSDPGFGQLDAREVRAMWTMLAGRAADLRVEYRDVRASDAEGSAHWTARYTFSKTGRAVVNEIDARFRFADGLFVEHHDHFDFHRWSRQSLGPIGLVAGWTPWLRSKVQREARAQLTRFMQKNQ